MKKLIALITTVMLFTVVGPTLAETVELSQPKNNTHLTNEQLLNLDSSNLVENQKIEQVDSTMTTEEAMELEQEILSLDETELLIDAETWAYRDTINPDFDVQELLLEEQKLEAELYATPEVTALFKKYGMPAIRATWHLAERMYERGVSPVQGFNAATKGKKYYDPIYNSAVYYYKGVAVARKGNSLTTTYKTSSPKSRWR
ncbi:MULTISPECIES: hypothetical protein [Bacillus]|uniref:hypothetical protein n=1 Tax=Bacillus TaxID=1386 RepID=UPI000771BAEC|nr:MULTISPECIES: hypothetical protein [Bacillus]OUA68158.1 hypothetical protein BK786_07830 [Bacillus thuringiensis serovar thailandensis]QXW42366.1 hypothetical protein KXJ78_27710 [Klebsiella grimontii]KAB7631101.1 DUF4258 domain-containing protein [Bacillus sp. B4-WWTP-NA-D-NA-NA]KXI54723.1 hypothetical protein ACS45_03890 [Bacillus cereus]MCU5385028.1 DUF4258 domain-containing protein [Bacillus cereus]